jgi:hypothetical protein
LNRFAPHICEPTRPRARARRRGRAAIRRKRKDEQMQRESKKARRLTAQPRIHAAMGMTAWQSVRKRETPV